MHNICIEMSLNSLKVVVRICNLFCVELNELLFTRCFPYYVELFSDSHCCFFYVAHRERAS